MHCAQRVQRVVFCVFCVSALLFCVLFAAAPLRADEAPSPDSQPAAQHPGEARLLPFKGYDLDGKPVDLNASVGARPVMLIFWATWCPTCRAELPRVNGLVKQYAGRMDFIGVNVGQNDTYKRAKAFADKYGMQYPTYFDSSGAVSRRYVTGVPTVVIADKKGIIRYYGHMVPPISAEVFGKLNAD